MLRRTFDAACLRMSPLVETWGLAIALGGFGFVAAVLIAVWL
jgi:hypothetical protein